MADPGDAWHGEEGNAKALPSLVRRCENQLGTQRFLDGAITRLFYGEPLVAAGTQANTSGIPRASTMLRAIDGLMQENLIKSVIEAQASMVVRKPAFRVITTGSSWAKQVAARRMSRLLSGIYSTSGLEAATPAIYRDSKRCIVAASKWSVDETGAIRCERALPHTISFNAAAGPNPREIYQRHGIPRAELQKKCPEHAAAIAKLPLYKPSAEFHIDGAMPQVNSDEVEVCEGWRTTRGEDKGWYAMVAGDLVLADEEWDFPVWPLVPLTDGDSYDSLAGTPLGRDLLPFQLKNNRMNRQIEENAAKCVNPRVAMPMGSEVQAAKLTGAMAEVMFFNAAGGQPQWLPGMMLPPQFYAEKERNKEAAFAQAGVSQSVAEGTKSPGLVSGRAQREEYDRASGRLVLDAEKLERWFERNAMTATAMMRQAYKGNSAMRIKAPNTRMLEEIDWSQVGDLKEDEIEVRAYITSSIPNTPAGRAETLAERVEAGVMSAQRAARWAANPDTARLEEQDSAGEDFCLYAIDSALVEGNFVAPEPILGNEGLGMLVDLARKELLRSMTLPEPPPDKNMELVRRLIAEAQLLMTPAAPAAGAPPQGVDPGLPGPVNAMPPPGAPPMDMPPPGAPPMAPPMVQ